MNKSLGGGDLGLSLTGMRIGPLDPHTHKPKVGLKPDVVKPEHTMGSLQPRMMKERTGFSGGFKIPEEFRKSKIAKKGLLHDKDQEEDLEATQQSQITKDEIFQQLNLGHSESGIGIGRHGTNSKSALAKDLVEGIEKDLEKLKRQQENLQLRKTLALTGQSVVEETQEEKNRELEARLKYELEQSGAHVIDASPKKFQVMRHQASQLASVKNLELDELEQMRYENERRLKELEEIYMRKKENSSVGRIMREKMGYSEKRSTQNTPRKEDFEREYDQDEDEGRLTKSQKKKKSVRIADEKENMDYKNSLEEKTASFPKQASRGPVLSKGFGEASRSASKKREKTQSPIHYDSPRRKLYEAKFEKYLANKQQKDKQEKKLETMKKEDFDRYTKGPDSPAKSSKRFGERSLTRKSYDPDALIPEDYDEELLVRKQIEDQRKAELLKKDKFRSLGVSNEDKMTFFLLKWIFNAIKRESSDEDPKLKGRSYVTKTDLIKQLGKNDELMKALGYNDQEEVSQAVRVCGSAKDGCLVWEEFLDFFFLRQASLQKRTESNDNWWRRIGNSDAKDPTRDFEAQEQEQQAKAQSNNNSQKTLPRYGSQAQQPQFQGYYKYEDPDKKPVKMTETLRILDETRKSKTALEVEEEFKALKDRKIQEQKQQKNMSPSRKGALAKKAGNYEYEFNDEDNQLEELGFKREKSQCLLLESQVFIMQEIFEAMDKYKDKILRRSEYIMALRTDERVVDFIDVDAVKVPYSSRILSLDQVLVEVERDELYEQAQLGKFSGQINHKEFITWREFLNYFNDYKEAEERNRKTQEIQKTRQNMQKERAQQNTEGTDQSVEIMSLMEKEKQRRLQELPKLKPADQIDISEKQLQLLKDIYDSLPKAQNVAKDMINTIDFFIATRKNPQLRALSSAIARDPEGYSRIPRETFQQVFDRMENELQSKQLEWATIVEYFTKRGRPLTKEEINRQIEDDRREREELEAKKRADDDAERRRLAKLMEDLEDKEDFEEFEQRQKNELAAKTLEEKRFDKRFDDEDEDDQAEEVRGRSRRREHRFLDDSDNESHDQDEYPQGYTSDPELMTGKRTYKPGGERNSRLSRAKSAKGSRRDFEEYNLKSAKLTPGDYAEHDKSLYGNKKKGKYGVTVPKPFGFDVRDKTRSKSIRERKVERMIAEKKIEEEAIIKHQFRSNPIPPEVLIPRYKTIMETNEQRRMEVKKNSMVLTKEREKPFSFYERDKNKKQPDPEDYVPHDLKKPQFKANPIPKACSVLIFHQMMKRQEEERQERIRKQAELNFSKAKLPDRMQMHQEKMKQQSQSQSQKTLAQKLGYSFQPKINELVTREQFEKAQQKFNSKLNKKKAQMQVTRPKSPNFTKTSSKTLAREYLDEQLSNPTVDKFKAAMQKQIARQASMTAEKIQDPSSTNAMNLGMKKRREEMEAKLKREEDKKREDKERLERQNKMKNVVQAAFKDKVQDGKEKQEEIKRKRAQQLREEAQRAKEDAQRREEKVRSMPLLVERLHGGKHNSNLAKIKATEQFLNILKDQGLDPKQHLTEEQKELLAEKEYIDRRKKELGK